MNAEELTAFARDRVFPTREERSGGGFDRSLWREMAELGLTGQAVDGEYGGGGTGTGDFTRGVSLLAGEGLDLGLVLSLVDHVMLCAYPLQAFGSRALKKRYLPPLCSGELIGAAAISEPGSGGDPSRMAATATEEQGGYRINGVKGPITNAPAADLFLVIASTDAAAGKEGLSAFLVERTRGVEVEEIELGYLATSPHGKVVFDGVLVPAGNLVGEKGWGHERVSRSVFMWERAVLIPALVCFMERWHQLIVSSLEPADIAPDLRVLMAKRKVETTAYRILGERLLELTFGRAENGRERMELLLFFGKALSDWVYSMRGIIADAGLPMRGRTGAMDGDLRLLEVGSSMLDWQFQKLPF
ncbi:MAG: acyl-CoA dehydrogenase family protein [Actinomycetota bacterium]|nr:acyl-CoA dehydrogenase family protein [Actinomycetota bacterium]MDD5666537.1 acyl-CoA dehydrogenase family protein [Actinomycetota bacterium]